MEQQEEENIPPFWLQTTGSGGRLRRKASSFFFNSGVLLLILLVIAFVFIFIIIPSLVSFTSQIFKPNLIKKSWDSLNLVLVLFAIVCGFLGRNNNNNNGSPRYQSMESSSSNVRQNEAQSAQTQRSYPSTPVNRWYQDRTASYNGLNRLRSFSSYPDLRQESSLWMNSDEQRWRFYDDTHLNGYRINNSDQVNDVLPPPQRKEEELKKLEDVDVVDVDASVKEVVYTPPPESPPPPPPPQSPPIMPTKAVKRKVKRTYEDIGYEKRKVESPPPSPPETVAQPPPIFNRNEKKRGKDLLMTPFGKKKKKMQRERERQKSVENLESLFDPQSSFYQSSIPPQSPAPPPPPPPPPPHFFQILFSTKKSRAKKALSHSVPHSAPPPPPPPPPRSVASSSRARISESRSTVQVAAVKTGGLIGRPAAEESVESGNLSPYNRIPPPPPLPPFKLTSWKFVRDGDYVRVASFDSSRSGSPDLESEESSPVAEPKDRSGGDSTATMPAFCPSPDVNTKAENFIARFRAGLKMEKMNSGKGRSNLGPGPDIVEGEGPT